MKPYMMRENGWLNRWVFQRPVFIFTVFTAKWNKALITQ